MKDLSSFSMEIRNRFLPSQIAALLRQGRHCLTIPDGATDAQIVEAMVDYLDRLSARHHRKDPPLPAVKPPEPHRMPAAAIRKEYHGGTR